MASGDLLNNSMIATRVGTTKTTANSAGITTVDTQIVTVTGFLVAGRTYGIRVDLRVSSSVAGGPGFVFLREDSVGGTQLSSVQVAPPTTDNNGFPVTMYAEYTAVSTGSKTFSVSMVRNGGTATLTMRAGATLPGYATIDYIPE